MSFLSSSFQSVFGRTCSLDLDLDRDLSQMMITLNVQRSALSAEMSSSGQSGTELAKGGA